MFGQYVALFIVSSLLFALGFMLRRDYRSIGEFTRNYLEPTLVFGPLGEGMLVPIGWGAMLLGLAGGGHAFLQMFLLMQA